ncbi:MAG: threonine-phosphate decarboxylase [Magnetococcales bacterium]|nr:threonine-phosphate decarboxylase [Magnetococcales bacterium]
MLKHGGGIREAAVKFGIPAKQWLDLSTGINPLGWQIPKIPDSCWLRLPEEGDGLERAAASYYGSRSFLPIAGSQAAIQVLPRLRKNFRVAILSPTYSEHAHAWGEPPIGFHEDSYGKSFIDNVHQLPLQELEETIELYDVVVVVNPNNPTGSIIKKERLLAWCDRLKSASQPYGGIKWLIVDEAFMDTTPDNSLLPYVGEPGLIILRSLGKFFGLAGARVGFIFAWQQLLDNIRELLGPWTISGPSRLIATMALQDKRWHEQTISRLEAAQSHLTERLADKGLNPTSTHPLFQWITLPEPGGLFNHLAKQGILIRNLEAHGGVRLGLPGVDKEWKRLESGLTGWR